MKIKSEIEHSASLVSVSRRVEIEEAEAVLAERRARLKAREGQILADPLLREVYGLLKSARANKVPGSIVNAG